MSDESLVVNETVPAFIILVCGALNNCLHYESTMVWLCPYEYIVIRRPEIKASAIDSVQ